MIRIAIDGPGGAGKSSLAKAVAKKLGIIYVDTGALYRTIGVYVLKSGVSPSDAERVTALLPQINIELKFVDGRQLILLNGNEVGDEIRTPDASMAASAVSAIPSVREFLLSTQRNIAESNSIIMDGRDIGTVILPHAEVKIFLTATPEARAKRRYNELIAKGIETTYEKVFSEMTQRDKNDSTRDIAPCVPASDAIILDNSDMTEIQTIDEVIKIIKKKAKKLKSRGTAFYVVIRAIAYPFYRLFNRISVKGKENIPKSGGALLCCNHMGINDVLVLGAVSPRQLHFLSKKEWFAVPILSSFISAMGAIKLDRGGKDVGALKNAIKCINDGKIITIFPQGHRYPSVDPAETPVKSGAGLIAYRSGADVIPVAIRTKNLKYRFMQKIYVTIGEPIKNSELGFKNGGSAEYNEATDLIFKRICDLGDFSSALPSKNDSRVDKK